MDSMGRHSRLWPQQRPQKRLRTSPREMGGLAARHPDFEESPAHSQNRQTPGVSRLNRVLCVTRLTTPTGNSINRYCAALVLDASTKLIGDYYAACRTD